MKRYFLISILITIVLVAILTPVVASEAKQISEESSSAIHGGSSGMGNGSRQQIEEQILNSTVQMLVQSWIVKPDDAGYEIDYSMGHATVKDDRYLVTHNHFRVPLSIRPQEGDPESYGMVTLLNVWGEVLVEAPLSDFELVHEDAETLVFAYKDERLFKELGLASAEFQAWESLPLEPGMEVAQVDWDGTSTRVDWATVQEVHVEDGVPRLVLADDTMIGASGGGVFWQGTHVANNWRLEEQIEATGAIVGWVTTVALNSAQVAGF